MSSTQQEEKPVQLKNIAFGLLLLPVIGIIIYALHSIGINVTPKAGLQTAKEAVVHNNVKKLSELDSAETEKFRNSFITNCEQSVGDKLSTTVANQYCTCTESKIEASFTISQVNSWDSLSDTELENTLQPYYEQCASEQGLS